MSYWKDDWLEEGGSLSHHFPAIFALAQDKEIPVKDSFTGLNTMGGCRPRTTGKLIKI